MLKKQKTFQINERLFKYGSPTWARTRDTRINSPMLYRLSYWGITQKLMLAIILKILILSNIFFKFIVKIPKCRYKGIPWTVKFKAGNTNIYHGFLKHLGCRPAQQNIANISLKLRLSVKDYALLANTSVVLLYHVCNLSQLNCMYNFYL